MELDSENKEAVEDENERKDKNDEGGTDKDTDEESDEESTEKSALLVKRGPIRTYINKKRAASKNTSPGPANKTIIPVVRENILRAIQGVGKPRNPKMEEDNDDENDSSSSSSSSSSIESDEGGYDPNALYCICRQKHNKRCVLFIVASLDGYDSIIHLSVY